MERAFLPRLLAGPFPFPTSSRERGGGGGKGHAEAKGEKRCRGVFLSLPLVALRFPLLRLPRTCGVPRASASPFSAAGRHATGPGNVSAEEKRGEEKKDGLHLAPELALEQPARPARPACLPVLSFIDGGREECAPAGGDEPPPLLRRGISSLLSLAKREKDVFSIF
jgi:hypothetical protein